MADVLALIPARAGSRGIPGKNFKRLVGKSPVQRALAVAREVGIEAVITTDAPLSAFKQGRARIIRRPKRLSSDTATMGDVVAHALQKIKGPDDQIIVILQPTQPLRTAVHVRQAIELLQTTSVDSVVSVVAAESPDKLMCMEDGQLYPWQRDYAVERRQDARPAYRRDGTVYAVRRYVAEFGDLYGANCFALIIPAAETCQLDTPADWAEAERRLQARA